MEFILSLLLRNQPRIIVNKLKYLDKFYIVAIESSLNIALVGIV